MSRRERHHSPDATPLRNGDPTIDEFIGEWWDRHAEVVYTRRDLIATIPVLVRWILPHLGMNRVRSISADKLTAFGDEITAAGATRATSDACFDILDDLLTCAVGWGVIPRSPLDDPDTSVWPCQPTGEVVPFPSRCPLSDYPDSA